MIYEEVFKAFRARKVKYVLVGGIAVNLHGALRNTADLDILVEMSDANLAKVVSILKSQGYAVRQPVDPMDLANEKIRNEWIHKKHMKAFNFYKDKELKEVDLILDSPVSYEEANHTAARVRAGSMILPVISIDHLVQMKKKTGRAVDELDVKELNLIKKMRK